MSRSLIPFTYFSHFPSLSLWPPPVCSLYWWVCLCVVVCSFFFLDSKYERNHIVFVSVWPISLGMIFSRSTHVNTNSKISFFFMMSTTSSLSIHLQTDSWAASIWNKILTEYYYFTSSLILVLEKLVLSQRPGQGFIFLLFQEDHLTANTWSFLSGAEQYCLSVKHPHEIISISNKLLCKFSSLWSLSEQSGSI